MVNERRVGEARKDGEEPRMLSLCPDRDVSDEVRGESSDSFPILEVVDVDLVFDLSSNGSIPPWLVLCFSVEKIHARLSCTPGRGSP